MTAIINNREFTVETTGLANVAYKFHSGRLTLTGIRNQFNKDIIVVMDKNCRKVGYLRESTWQQVRPL